MLNRRNFLKSTVLTGGLLGGAMVGLPNVSLAAAHNNKRLIIVYARGGWDGLGLVQPYGDSDLMNISSNLLPTTNSLRLDGMFALHPALKTIHDLSRKNEASFIHAAGWKTHTRSHFDAQRMIENGDIVAGKTKGLQTGWLNRTADIIAKGNPSFAISGDKTIPFILKGKNPVASAGGLLPSASQGVSGTFQTLMEWQSSTDSLIQQKFQEAVSSEAVFKTLLSGSEVNSSRATNTALEDIGAKYNTKHERNAAVVASLMQPNNGYRVGVLELNGWDHHKNLSEQLNFRAEQLDNTIRVLKENLGNSWQNTMVLCLSEFGRQAIRNGQNGRDHGTGQCVMVIGGAVRGKGIILKDNKWPGLAFKNLVNSANDPNGGGKKDSLMATTDIRQIFFDGLVSHMGMSLGRLKLFFLKVIILCRWED